MKRIGIAVLSIVIGSAAQADTQYISDKLVVSVYAEANQESDKVASLDSGDAVETIEKAEGYAHIKLPDGREGWIKSNYLVSQAPAIVRLKELERERGTSSNAVPAAIAEEIKQLKERNTALATEVDSLKQTAVQKPAVPTASEQATLQADHSSVDEVSAGHAWKWSGAIAIIAGTLGFALGYRTIANRIERKYGKLRIY